MDNELSYAFEDFPPYVELLSSNSSLLLVSHLDDDSTYKSASISLDDLAIQLRNEALHVRSAAYCESSEFALANHDHDIYTSAMYDTTFNENDNISTLLRIHDATNDKDYDISLSVIKFDLTNAEKEEIEKSLSLKRPKLGMLSFVAVSNFTSYNELLDPTNDIFMGWVAANGATYSLSDFVLSNDISNVFKMNADNTRFTIPQLQSFCKMNDYNDSESYAQISGENHVGLHNHSIGQIEDDVSFNVNANPDTNPDQITYTPLSVATTRECIGTPVIPTLLKRKSGYTKVHHGYSLAETLKMKFTNKLNKNTFSNSLQFIEEDGNDDISRPASNLMPSLIYVGYSRWSKIQEIVTTH